MKENKGSLNLLATEARKLLFRIQSEAKRKLDTSKWPDLTAKNFQELWEMTRSLAAFCLEEAEKTQDPKMKRLWISHGLRALRLAGKWLEHHEIDEMAARLDKVEKRLEEQNLER